MKKSNRLVRAMIGLAICLVFLVSVFAINAFADSTNGAAVRIGDTEFNTVSEAIDAANAGDVVTFLRDVTETDGIIIDKDLKINLNGFTYTVTEGLSTNNRNIKVIGSASLDVYNGRMVAQGGGTTKDNGTGLYGTIRFESTGELSLTDLELENYRPWGLNVKVLSGSATLNNVHITSRYGGGIEVSSGYATLENCSVTQTGKYDYCSTAVSVSNNGFVGVYSGTYTTDNYAVNTMSSGGLIAVYAGQFKAPTVINIDAENHASCNIQIWNGSFEGNINNNNPAAVNSGITILGGTFDREVPAEYIDTLNEAVSIGGGKYAVAMTGGVVTNINSGVSYDTVQEAINDALENDIIQLNGSVIIDTPIVIDKSISLNGCGYGIVYKGSDRAINIPSVDGTELDVAIFNLNISAPKAQRGINIGENGIFDFQHINILPTFGKVPIYGINAPATADGATIIMYNNNIYANIAVNLWGEDMTVIIRESTLVSVDNNSYENYAAVKINNDGENSADRTEVSITDSTVIAKDENGEPAAAFTNSAKDSGFVVENCNVTGEEVRFVAVVRYEDGTSYCFTSLKDAVEVAVRDGRDVTLLDNITETEIVTVTGKVTIYGNGYTLTSTAPRIINIDTDEEVTIENLNIVGEGVSARGINVINKPATVNLSNVQISQVTHYALHVATSAGSAEINVDYSILMAYGALAIYGEGTKACVTESKLIGENTYQDNGSNDFATVAVGAENVKIDIFGGTVSASAHEDSAHQTIVGAISGTSSGLNIFIDADLAVIGKATIIGFAREDNPSIILRSKYAAELAKAGFGTKSTNYASLVSVDFEKEIRVVEYVVDGEIIATFYVEVGKRVENPPAIPEKEGHTDFAPAWDKSSENITENLTINAVYYPNRYTVTTPENPVGFIVNAPDYVTYGKNANIYVSVEKGYFKGDGFKVIINGTETESENGTYVVESVKENITVEVLGVEEITYYVIYTDGVSDEVVFTDQITGGLRAGDKIPAFAGTPEREGYTFKGWTPEVAETVTTSVTYTAIWEIIPVHVHEDEDGKWEHFGNNHFYTCACGEHFGIVACSGGSATCKDQAICDVCQNGYGETLEHNYSIPDCKTLATCTDCGATTGELAPHRYGNATCEVKSTCSVCGETKGELAAHKDSDKDGKCDVCELVLNSDPADGKDENIDNQEEEGGLSGGAIAAIVIGIVLVLGGGGFALYWFVIRKKTV